VLLDIPNILPWSFGQFPASEAGPRIQKVDKGRGCWRKIVDLYNLLISRVFPVQEIDIRNVECVKMSRSDVALEASVTDKSIQKRPRSLAAFEVILMN
jgi:hypothetical protein